MAASVQIPAGMSLPEFASGAFTRDLVQLPDQFPEDALLAAFSLPDLVPGLDSLPSDSQEAAATSDFNLSAFLGQHSSFLPTDVMDSGQTTKQGSGERKQGDTLQDTAPSVTICVPVNAPQVQVIPELPEPLPLASSALPAPAPPTGAVQTGDAPRAVPMEPPATLRQFVAPVRQVTPLKESTTAVRVEETRDPLAPPKASPVPEQVAAIPVRPPVDVTLQEPVPLQEQVAAIPDRPPVNVTLQEPVPLQEQVVGTWVRTPTTIAPQQRAPVQEQVATISMRQVHLAAQEPAPVQEQVAIIPSQQSAPDVPQEPVPVQTQVITIPAQRQVPIVEKRVVAKLARGIPLPMAAARVSTPSQPAAPVRDTSDAPAPAMVKAEPKTPPQIVPPVSEKKDKPTPGSDAPDAEPPQTATDVRPERHDARPLVTKAVTRNATPVAPAHLQGEAPAPKLSAKPHLEVQPVEVRASDAPDISSKPDAPPPASATAPPLATALAPVPETLAPMVAPTESPVIATPVAQPVAHDVPKDAVAPPSDQTADSPAPIASRGDLAFAARLSTPNFVSSSTEKPTPEQNTAKPTPRAPVAAQPAPPKQATPEPANPRLIPPVERFAKPEPVAPPVAPLQQAPSASTLRQETSPGNATLPTRTERVIEPPAEPPASSRDITVRVADVTDRGASLRFVEHGGEVRVSVRTPDAELAQTLRSGLNEFVSKLEHDGIQAEVWRPGSGASQDDGQNRQANPDSSRQNQPGSQQQREQERQNSNKPRWVEELETFIGGSVRR